MKWPRIKIPETFIGHAIEVAIEFYDIVVWVTVIGENIMAWSVPTWSPRKFDTVVGKYIRAPANLAKVSQLEGKVKHTLPCAGLEVHCMMICVAAHEDKVVLDPVGSSKSQYI